MKGSRTQGRFGVNTNKSIKKNPSYAIPRVQLTDELIVDLKN